ncbi:MAG: PadR family transcriptional regulator [Defluviitaleaceae bacterium]|nr:PadR family transcriptional regulator [Defluviitaleaceae bacterium]MCL2837313.1 PadR family transcriptional regulator [Defluviitaleaceae bacterium]
MEAQIKKGILEMCVLYTIRDREMYGYDVMKSMKRHFPEVNESTFYAILRRLHADGSAEITLGEESNGPTRKYYRITAAGQDVLRLGIESWKRIRAIVDEMGI